MDDDGSATAITARAQAPETGWWGLLERCLAQVSEATGLGGLFDRLAQWREARRIAATEVAFTVALVALSAKMAKADGIVRADEVAAFRRIVEVPAGEEASVDRLFRLAQGDVAGFESHAARIAALAEGDLVFLEDVLDGLFHIAAADDWVHAREHAFLEQVAAIFGFSRDEFERIAAGFMRLPGVDPYRVLGVGREAGEAELKAAHRRLAAECHPDRHIARGLPPEAMALVSDRMAAINAAWDRIRRERRFGRDEGSDLNGTASAGRMGT